MENPNPLRMIMIEASSSMIGITKAHMNKLLDCPQLISSGLGILRYLIILNALFDIFTVLYGLDHHFRVTKLVTCNKNCSHF
jgi:hypothetical protein